MTKTIVIEQAEHEKLMGFSEYSGAGDDRGRGVGMSADRMNIARRFRLVQSTLKMNGAELARALDTSPSFVSDVGLGKSMPGMLMIAALVNKFGVDANWLITGHGKAPGEIDEMEILGAVDRIKKAIHAGVVAGALSEEGRGRFWNDVAVVIQAAYGYLELREKSNT